jgi:hypothetical protein
MKRFLTVALLAGLTAAGSISPASAQPSNAEIMKEIEALRTKLDTLEKQLTAANEAQAAPAPAAEAEREPAGVVSTGGPPVKITGLVDAYYSNNFNNPADRTNQLRFFDETGKGFALNMAKLEFEADADPIGFRVDLLLGPAGTLFHGGLEPGRLGDFRFLQQAYFTASLPGDATLDIGKFGTIAGLEVAETHLNWNYSRGILWGWAEPFYHFGARLNKPFSDQFAGTVMLVNGWNSAVDDNTAKSFGYQGAYTPNDKFWAIGTMIHGPEKDDLNQGWRNYYSFNTGVTPNDHVALMFNLDGGWENYADPSTIAPVSGSDKWYGFGAYLRLAANDKWAFSQRYEWFNDEDAWATGTNQKLQEYTATLEYKPRRDFFTRLEYRRDWSNMPFFNRGNELGIVKDQDTILLGMGWVFGPPE